MSTEQEPSTDATETSNDKQPAAAASTVVIISSSMPAENLITNLKGNSVASESAAAAADAEEVDDVSELTREQWKRIM